MIDTSNIRTVRIHKEQFDAIDLKADCIILTCIEDGRSISFERYLPNRPEFEYPEFLTKCFNIPFKNKEE